MSLGEPDVWLIAGPTASGKSALALRLASVLGATIVNADSMQVYRDLRLLTARPSPEEEATAPHRLYGAVDGGEAYSVGRWLADALGAIAQPGPKVLVGGTGLYFRALTVGLADMPATPNAVRDSVTARLDDEGEAAFRVRLRAVDPEAEARIEAGDRQRLIRAATVYESSGRSLSDWRRRTRPALERWRAVVLEPPRDALYARCDLRLETMLRAGALGEVEALMARGLPLDRPVMKAVGVRELATYLSGAATLEQATAAAQMQTRRYAKRQLTWFRNQTPDWPRVTALDAEAAWRQLCQAYTDLTAAQARACSHA